MNPWTTTALLLASGVLMQADAQTHRPNGWDTVGDGRPRDSTGSTAPFTANALAAGLSLSDCRSQCQANHPNPGNLKGVSYRSSDTSAADDPSNAACTCWTGSGPDVHSTQTGSAGTYGTTYRDIGAITGPSSTRVQQRRLQATDPPTASPTASPTSAPSKGPTTSPSHAPSSVPSEAPSASNAPSSQPSSQPSVAPTNSDEPSSIPSEAPSGQPSSSPSGSPSSSPSEAPSGQPSSMPSGQPSSVPSEAPSSQPSSIPSSQPSTQPSESPSSQPSSQPSAQPSAQPSETPSANPSQGCENIRTDCGWGIFNPWTCRCDCPVGICLDHNEQCYHPCRDTIHVNPWAGCAPGWDCPWYPDHDHGHCMSEMHQPNNFEIYRTRKECCDAHYGGSNDCMVESQHREGPHQGNDPFPWAIHFPGTQPWTRPFAPPEAENHWGTEASHRARWFPDLIGKLNCVYGANYENWMQTPGFEEDYLFKTSDDCCEQWYPKRGSSCPDTQEAANPEAEDEPWHSAPYPMKNYYFPDFAVNNCGYGWDYPAWYGHSGYEKSYLFTNGAECCNRFFPGVGGCPYEHTKQQDYYWTSYEKNIGNLEAMPVRYNHTFYPDLFANTCVNGTDYPEWMASDRDYIRLYLFKKLDGCCEHWFTDWDIEGCKRNVIQGVYIHEPCHLNRPGGGTSADCIYNNASSITNITTHRLGMWYPDLDGLKCKNDGAMQEFMLQDDYTEWYLFNTREQCCAAFGYC